MTRDTYIQELSRRIGRRNLIWFGHSGRNARPLAGLPQFAAAYSIFTPAGLPGREVCIERLTGERMRQQGVEVRPDLSDVHRDFYRRLLASLSEPAVTVTHQASRFFASACFIRRDSVEHLGLFHERQVVFDYKPWVESELQKAGIQIVPWRYLPTYDGPALIRSIEDALREGPVVLRASRSISGRGLTLVRQPEDIPHDMPEANPDGFIAIAPYLEPSVPLNVNACVFPGGVVSLHSPSLQLIGIAGAARNPFNYCGNDFARVRALGHDVLTALQEMVVRVGRWLESMGYLGAFGVDALLYQGTVYMTEVNPRFQGSSMVSAYLDETLGRPDMYLSHLGAFLGLPSPDPWDLPVLAAEQPAVAQIYLRNGHERVVLKESPRLLPEGVDCWMLPERGVIVHPEAQLCRVIVQGAVTDNGWRLFPDTAAWYAELPRVLFEPVHPPAAVPTAHSE